MNSSPTPTHDDTPSRRGASSPPTPTIATQRRRSTTWSVDESYADDAARMLLGFPLPSRVEVEPPSTVGSAVRPPRPTPAT
jgi:hypothetical protein